MLLTLRRRPQEHAAAAAICRWHLEGRRYALACGFSSKLRSKKLSTSKLSNTLSSKLSSKRSSKLSTWHREERHYARSMRLQ